MKLAGLLAVLVLAGTAALTPPPTTADGHFAYRDGPVVIPPGAEVWFNVTEPHALWLHTVTADLNVPFRLRRWDNGMLREDDMTQQQGQRMDPGVNHTIAIRGDAAVRVVLANASLTDLLETTPRLSMTLGRPEVVYIYAEHLYHPAPGQPWLSGAGLRLSVLLGGDVRGRLYSDDLELVSSGPDLRGERITFYFLALEADVYPAALDLVYVIGPIPVSDPTPAVAGTAIVLAALILLIPLRRKLRRRVVPGPANS